MKMRLFAKVPKRGPMKCDRCNGTGKVSSAIPLTGKWMRDSTSFEKDCSICKGRGKL